MNRLDRRGVAALEFSIVGAIFFITMFVIFGFGQYAITIHSLRMLANAGARDLMINCYTDAVTTQTTYSSPSDCQNYKPLPSNTARQAVAPFLFSGGSKPSLKVSLGTKTLIVIASQSMLMPVWGKSLNAQATTSIPF
jgi:hypothetical protein